MEKIAQSCSIFFLLKKNLKPCITTFFLSLPPTFAEGSCFPNVSPFLVGELSGDCWEEQPEQKGYKSYFPPFIIAHVCTYIRTYIHP